jgi:Flp pilus assembly protein TadD
MAYAWGYSLVWIGGREKKAIEVLNQLMLSPLPPDSLLSVGDLYGVLEDYDHAVTAYRRALELDPAIARAHYKMGAALIRLSRMQEAITELQAEYKMTPKDVEVRYNLAYALLENSQREPAVEILRALVADAPNHALAHYLLGKALLDAGQLPEAVQQLEVAVKLDPDREYIHYQLQLAYRRSDRKEDADREAKIYKEMKNRKREAATIPMPERKQP